MPTKSRLSRKEKGKNIANTPSPAKDLTANGSPLDEFDLIHRDAMRDTENMSLSQRLLVAESHRQIREETAGRTFVGVGSDASSSRGSDREDRRGGSRSSERDGSGASKQASTPPRRVHLRVRFDQIDCRPTIYHPGGIFEELPPLPREVLRDPQVQSWGNVFSSCSSSETVKRLLRESGGAGVTFLIPSAEQRPWSPPVGYQYVYESYFQDQTKLWFPIPRLITSYAASPNTAPVSMTTSRCFS